MAVAQKSKSSNKVISKAKVAVKAKALAEKTPSGKKTKPVVEKTAKAANPIEMAKAALKKANTAAEVPKPAAKAKSRKISVAVEPGEAVSQLAQKWAVLYKKADQIEAKPYNMRNVFEEKTAIVHKLLGWGYILANRNDRLEVLFKDGIKYLISNYQP
jgi:hypothetical protein